MPRRSVFDSSFRASLSALEGVPSAARSAWEIDGRRRDFARYVVGELGNTASTAYTYEHNLRCIERYLSVDAAELTPDLVRRFLREAVYHPATKNGVLVAVKAYSRFSLLEGWGNGDVTRLLGLRGPKQRRRPKKPLTREEVHVLLDACRTSNEYRVIYLGLYEGLRVSDSANISEPNVLSDRLAFTSVKGAKELEIPLHDEVARVKRKILEKSTTRGTLKHTCRSLAFYTGVNFSSRRLRSTFADRLDELGNQEGVVIELLGHEQVTVFRRHYSDVKWEAMASAMRGLWY